VRAYSRVAPQFWIGATGRALRKAGRDAQVVALYLVTCPSATMSGVFPLELPTLCHQVRITKKKARAALAVLERENFAFYDAENEAVWIPEMARFQVGEQLEPDDKRIKGLVRQLEAVSAPRFAPAFYEKYRRAFHLPEKGPWEPLRSPSDGPPKERKKALRSQAQEQAQAQAQEQEQAQSEATARTPGEEGLAVEGLTPEELVQTWNANRGGMAEALSPTRPERQRRLRAFSRHRPELRADEFGAVVKALGTDAWACGTTPRRSTPLTIDEVLSGDAFERQREKLRGGPRRLLPRAGPQAATNTPGRYDDIESTVMKP
jgi:hypothetical protein